MKNITRWQPDTCECEIEIVSDDQTPGVLELNMMKPCKAHEKHRKGDKADSIYTENKLKNETISMIRHKLAGVNSEEEYMSLLKTKKNEKAKALGLSDIPDNTELGQLLTRQIESQISVNHDELEWSFDANRKLKIKLPDRLSNRKDELKSGDISLQSVLE
jgi:hypothetical protein